MKKEEVGQVCGTFIKSAYETINGIKQRAKELLTEIMEKHYADFHWDFTDGDAPSMMSKSFGDEPTDCYITRLYADRNNVIRIDLYAYYLGEERIAVFIGDEPDFDYLDMLEYIENKVS